MDSELSLNDAAETPWREILPDEVARHPVVPDNSQRVRLWALTLDARSVPCQIDNGQHGRRLLVPPEQHAEAIYELRRFEELNRNWPAPEPQHHPLTENTLATLSILILLATFHNITQMDVTLPGLPMPDWVSLGNAQAAKILEGEWWRLVTALTLHADWAHLSSNLAIGGIFVVFLCRELGSGLAWSLLLGAGALGNLVNAFLQPANHRSVGASTAVFGAVGILAAISFVRNRRNLRKRWMLPVASALALLALLGTEGKNTDLGAHLFGFIYGGCLGLITEYLINRHGRPGWFMNALLASASVAVVVAAWWLAVFR
jgi:membrane associated rhomboid family serine protease